MIDTTGELITSTMAILRTEETILRGGRCREVLTRVNEQKNVHRWPLVEV